MKSTLCAFVVVLWAASPASAESLKFVDPSGDDFGPGTYVYPTDTVYKPGSFDIRSVQIIDQGATIEIAVEVGAPLEDPWKTGSGFSVQFVQLYIDMDGKEGSGHVEGMPGSNVAFSPKDAWDKVVLISPQSEARVRYEVKQKAPQLAASVVVPTKVVARGRSIVATVRREDLGGAPSTAWGVQAVMQSNEGFPSGRDVLSRKVDQFEGSHKFGGGSDGECDPHVMDILVAPAKGGDAEKDGQKRALQYQCGPDGASVKRATLPMVRL